MTMTDEKKLEPENPAPHAAEAASTPDAPNPSNAPSPPSPPRRTWVRYLPSALAVVAALVIGGLAGVLIGQNTAHPPQRAGFTQGGGMRGGDGIGQGGAHGGPRGTHGGHGPAHGPRADGAFTAGTITAIDGSTITVKLPDGSTVKVMTSDSTKVTETTRSSVDKLKTGDTVTVIGRKDASGDVDAATIAEGKSGFAGLRGGGRRGSGSGSGD
jgi:hypothetical protein